MTSGIYVPRTGGSDVERRQIPRIPATLDDLGLSEEFIIDLLLKTLYMQGARTGQQLTESLCLPFPFVDEQVLMLQQRRFVEVRGTPGPSRAGYTFDLTGAGRDRAREAAASSQYVGPAPVPLQQYRRWVEAQTIRQAHVTRQTVEEGFSWMVLAPEMIDQIGPAINSAKSLFLYGESGNGKTAIAETIARMLGGSIFIPYAIEIDGQIMVLYDPVYHHPPDDTAGKERDELTLDALWVGAAGEYDRRFIRVKRPVVLTGGELTLDQLDLEYDYQTKMYQAPFQMKANGGVLIVDDFGRQRVPPRDLLNRWIVPLEKRVDFLSLHTGNKFPVPFDCLLIFATNIDAERAGGGGVPPAHPLQDHGREPDPGALRADLRALLRRGGSRLSSGGGGAGLPRLLRAVQDRAAGLPSARPDRSPVRHRAIPGAGAIALPRPGRAVLSLVLPRLPNLELSFVPHRGTAGRGVHA